MASPNISAGPQKILGRIFNRFFFLSEKLRWSGSMGFGFGPKGNSKFRKYPFHSHQPVRIRNLFSNGYFQKRADLKFLLGYLAISTTSILIVTPICKPFLSLSLSRLLCYTETTMDEETQAVNSTTDDSGEDFYEMIEAPKFVDFTISDHFIPNDRYWFCSRVGLFLLIFSLLLLL